MNRAATWKPMNWRTHRPHQIHPKSPLILCQILSEFFKTHFADSTWEWRAIFVDPRSKDSIKGLGILAFGRVASTQTRWFQWVPTGLEQNDKKWGTWEVISFEEQHVFNVFVCWNFDSKGMEVIFLLWEVLLQKRSWCRSALPRTRDQLLHLKGPHLLTETPRASWWVPTNLWQRIDLKANITKYGESHWLPLDASQLHGLK